MGDELLIKELIALAITSEADVIGFADLRDLPEDWQVGYPFAVSLAVILNPRIIKGIRSGPTADYYAEYQEVNEVLNDLAKKVAGFLKLAGYRAVAVAATDSAIDTGESSEQTDMKTLTAGFSHKMIATRAGLGWIGKNDLLVTQRYGSALRLVTVLTDAPLPAGTPIDEPVCGNCRLCVDACPAKALSGEDWYPGLKRESLVDVHRCRETMRKLMEKNTGEAASICGICIAVCPWTRKYLTSHIFEGQ